MPGKLFNKVFGIGFHKTGTSTLGECFRQFGFRHNGFNPVQFRNYVAGDMDRVIDNASSFDSFENWPWALIYRELDEAFPNSRFVLTTRIDTDIWFDSLCGHSKRWKGPTEFRDHVYGCSYPDQSNKDHHVAVYQKHNQDVRDYFTGRDCLLEVCWEAGDGWRQLADFLDMPIPDAPLPHKNKRFR